MRILWDMRLFSYGYGQRGCGTWTKAMALAIKEASKAARHEVIIWGNKDHVPEEIACCASTWIAYKKGNWKTDLLFIPFLIVRHRIRVFHYWVAMGPLFKMGMGLFHPKCKACLCIHDIGVEYCRDYPFGEHIRKTYYWKTQKHLLSRQSLVCSNSIQTKNEILKLTKGTLQSFVLYMPVVENSVLNENLQSEPRKKMFITLGGALHKNIATVIRAFGLFQMQNPNFSLIICGTVGKEELPPATYEKVFFEDYSKYEYYLENATAMIIASNYEGLGIPLLEAMNYSCPLIASDIEVFHESCGDGARYVDPKNAQSINEAMQDVEANQQQWARKSACAASRYRKMSEHAGKQWLKMYETM